MGSTEPMAPGPPSFESISALSKRDNRKVLTITAAIVGCDLHKVGSEENSGIGLKAMGFSGEA